MLTNDKVAFDCSLNRWFDGSSADLGFVNQVLVWKRNVMPNRIPVTIPKAELLRILVRPIESSRCSPSGVSRVDIEVRG